MPVFTAIAALAGTIVSRLFPDKTAIEQQDLQVKIQSLIMEDDLIKGQLAINAAEASNPNLFVSGARPFIMWGLGTILIFYAFLYTVCSFAVALKYNVIQLPPMDPMIRDLILGLLGLGHITRTFEKIKGTKNQA